jgi:NADH-quinone oxidoreductase subunit J
VLLNAQEASVSIARVVFYVEAVVVIALAIRMVTTKQLARSLLLHIVTLFLLGIVYLTVGANLMGAVQIMVYAGSVTVLLVFALMLTPIGYGATQALDHPSYVRAIVATAAILLVLGYVVLSVPAARTAVAPPDLESVATELFVSYAYPFELLSLVLMVALAGVAVIAARTTDLDSAKDTAPPSEPS